MVNSEHLARQILTICGGGPTLVIGRNQHLLVGALLRQGVDAHGVTTEESKDIQDPALKSDQVPDAPFDRLPCQDEAYQTITIWLGPVRPGDPALLATLPELYRATRRFLVIALETPASPNAQQKQAGRSEWEATYLKHGFRRHPLGQLIKPYETLDCEEDHLLIFLEKIPPEAWRAYPPKSMRARRNRPMDMLREAGRHSDAHIARYILASQFIRPGDSVLNAAEDLGHGSAILASASQAARVIGVDLRNWVIEYAQCQYQTQYPIVEFHRADAAQLDFLSDASIDFVAAFETLARVPNPKILLAELRRVLRPGGRVIFSIPTPGSEPQGDDYKPNHLDWRQFLELVSDYFLLDTAYAQTGGGILELGNRPRKIQEISLVDPPSADAERWILAAMKDPLGHSRDGYVETIFPEYAQRNDINITAFSRDYDNPWLVRSMITIGMRMANRAQLQEFAKRVMNGARPGSPDQGAALCVLTYGLLDAQVPQEPASIEMIECIRRFQQAADDTPHAWRWCISNQYAAARLLLALGRRAEARKAFLDCAQMDFLRFSPLLATKTIDALHMAGLISFFDGDTSAAREFWQRALKETHRALTSDWREVWGIPEVPVSFGLPEVTQLCDLASRCARGLQELGLNGMRHGAAWVRIQANMAWELNQWKLIAQQREAWIGHQENGIRWLEGQVKGWQQKEAELNQAKSWFDEQTKNWQQKEIEFKDAALEHERKIAELEGWIAELNQAKSWLEGQLKCWQQKEAELEHAIAEKDWKIKELENMAAFLQEEQANLQQLNEDHRNTIKEQEAWIGELNKAKDWIEGEYHHLMEELSVRDEKVNELQDWIGKLESVNKEFQGRITHLEMSLQNEHERADIIKTTMEADRQSLLGMFGQMTDGFRDRIGELVSLQQQLITDSTQWQVQARTQTELASRLTAELDTRSQEWEQRFTANRQEIDTLEQQLAAARLESYNYSNELTRIRTTGVYGFLRRIYHIFK